MKKKNLLKVLAVFTIGSAAALTLAFAGCKNTADWKSNADGHWKAEDKSDLVPHVDEDKNGVCDVCKFELPDDGGKEEDTEFTVTLNAGDGTLDGASSLTTVNGKLATLPTPQAPAGYKFVGWYDAAADGNEVTTDTVFTADDEIFARWCLVDGIYTADGTLLFELEQSTPDDTALTQFGSEEIALEPGDVFVIKLNGETLTHDAGKLELWLADGCHGIAFDQAAGTFTVKEQAGDEGPRGFKLYAKYYTDGTPCWSIYVTDGLTDALHVGGAYLVGGGWTNADWSIVTNNYIDPEAGLTVTLSGDASFKITDCIEPVEGSTDNRGWAYNSASYYKVKDDVEGYLDFSQIGASGNGSVITPGTYTITIVKDGEEFSHFLFTPEEGLNPAPVEDKYTLGGYYLAGAGFDGAAWSVKEGFEIDSTDGLTVTFTKGAQFQVVICTNAATGANPTWCGAGSYYRMAEGKESGYITLPDGGNATVKTAGTYTITVDNSEETPVFVITPAADLEPDAAVEILHYYIKGLKVTNNWQEIKTDEYELKETAEGSGIYTMEIELASKDQFMFYGLNVVADTGDSTPANKYIQYGQLADGITCVTQNGSNFETVAAGTYTFTFNAAENKLSIEFVASEVPEPETVLHYYVKGSKVTNNWQELKTEDYELKETAEDSGIYTMTIEMEAGDEFMFYGVNVEVESGNSAAAGKYIQSGQLAEGVTCVSVKGSNFETVAAGTYTFTFNAEENKLSVEFVAAEPDAPAVDEA